jgi:hypothetical protein
MIRTNYLGALNLLELWALLHFILGALACLTVRPILLGALLLISGTFRLGLCVLLAFLICPLSSDPVRRDRCLSIVEFGLAGVTDIEVADTSAQLEGSLIALNYPANFTEYLVLPLYLRSKNVKFAILTGRMAGKWARMFLGNEAVIALNLGSGNYEAVKEAVRAKLAEHYAVIVYPERNFASRERSGRIVDLRTGVFAIANELVASLIVGTVTPVRHTLGFVSSPRIHLNLEAARSLDAYEVTEQMRHLLGKHELSA